MEGVRFFSHLYFALFRLNRGPSLLSRDIRTEIIQTNKNPDFKNGRNFKGQKWTFDFEFFSFWSCAKMEKKNFGIQKCICSFDLCYFIKRCARKSYLNIDTWRHVNFIIPTLQIQHSVEDWHLTRIGLRSDFTKKSSKWFVKPVSSSF